MSLPRAILIAWMGCPLINGCATGMPVAAVSAATYVVRPHDTLYSIAWRHGLDYRDLAAWNRIGSDYRLSVGQVLVLTPPHAAGGGAGTLRRSSPQHDGPSAAPVPNRQRPESGGGARPIPPPVRTAAATAAVAALVRTAQWVWPTDRVAPPRAVPGGGVLLLGKLGQGVRAASAGRVVYTGSGLRGYGELIIIKHGDSLLSSYAHNRELLVHEGEEVTGGQLIARMGTGPRQIAALYFEIRVNGKPVDPVPFLPSPR